jgi:GAF domain-containing protein/anti-sigma regulatory factor (Ser/Thr protein kinase)
LISVREQQAAVAEILRVISRSPKDLQAVFDVIATSARRFCSAEDAMVALVEGDRLVGKAHDGEVGWVVGTVLLDRQLPATRCIVDARTIHVRDMQNDTSEDFRTAQEIAAKYGIRTVLATPMFHDGKAIGSITLRRTEVRPFTDEQVELVRTFADQAAIAIENVQLFNETKESLERQTAIGEILRVMSSSPTDVQPVLDAIAKSASEFCGAPDVLVNLLEGGMNRMRAHYGNLEATPIAAPIGGGSVSGQAMLERRTVQVHDLQAEAARYPFGAAASPTTRAILASPLLRMGEARGAIILRRSEATPFTQRQIELAETFADQAAIAIENVRLFNETKESLGQQTALSDVLRTISRSAFDLDAVLRTIVERAAALGGGETAGIFRREGNEAVVLAQFGPTLPASVVVGTRLPVDEHTLIGRALITGQRQYVADAIEHPDLPQSGPRTRLMIPFLRDGRAIGVLGVSHNLPRPFSDRELQMLETFADQAAIAIENVRLFNETKESLERQTALAEILRVIADSPADQQPVLDAIARNTTRYCGAGDAALMLIEGDDLVRVAHHGPIPVLSSSRQPLDDTAVGGRAVLERRTIHIADALGAEGAAFPGTRARSAETGQRGTLAAPLLRDGIPIGLILLRKMEPSGFSQSQIQLVEAFADQAVIAIENVRLFKETREALERQTATSEVLKTISRAPFELQPILDTLVQNAARLALADNADLVSFSGGVLRDVARVGETSEEYRRVIEDQMHGRGYVPQRGTLVGRTLLERRPVHIIDVLEDPEYEWRDAQRAGGYRTLLGVPLMRQGEPIGVIVLWRRAVKPFTNKQIELLTTFADQAVIAMENVRLFNETKEALEQQIAVGDVLKTISRSAFDLQPVLDIVLNNAVRLAGADIGWLSRVEHEQFTTVAYSTEFPESVREELVRQRAQGHIGGPWIPLGKGGGLMGFTLAEGRTIHLPDVKEDPELKASVVARLTASRTVVGVPMLRDGRTIGGMVLARYEVRPFGERELELVQTFADQAAIAIENVRLFNETKASLGRQTAVAQVLGKISQSGFQLQPVLESVIEAATKLCEAQQGFIYRREGVIFRLVVAHGITPEFKAFTEANPVNPMGRGTVTGRVAEDRKAVHIPDVLADHEYTYWEAQRLGNFRAILGVPMMRDDEVIGVMLLWRTEPQPFAEDQISLVTTFANQATIAIENVRLFDETKEALDQQSAISEVLKTISGTVFELRPTLQTVVQNAAQLADADLAWMSQRSERDAFTWGARYARTPELARVFEENFPDLDPQVTPGTGQGLMSRLYVERRTIALPDIEAEPELLEKSRVAKATGVRSVVGVPIVSESNVVGAIVLARREVRPFSVREVRVVETFADQAAIAIRNVRLFNEIQDKSRELEVASRHKSEFLANMSHELRTPLNAIIGFSEVLAQGLFGDVNEKQREYLNDVIGSGQHLLSLINDILDLSKIEAGRMELELSTFAFRSALQSGVTIVRERAARNGIALNVDVSDEVGQVEADERKVKQVLYNLLSNAVKFTPDGGNVNVSVRRDNGDVRVDVQDNGIGIAEADQARIFEEFQQVGRERSREGTGLGLTLTKRFVELHGGRIWLESAPGRGSTFTFTLPLRQAAPVRA